MTVLGRRLVLRRMEKDLAGADQRLAGLFSIFTALAEGQDVPDGRLKARYSRAPSGRARLARRSARSPSRRAGLAHRVARSPSQRARLARRAGRSLSQRARPASPSLPFPLGWVWFWPVMAITVALTVACALAVGGVDRAETRACASAAGQRI